MLLKRNARFYVEPDRLSRSWRMLQTSSPEVIAVFGAWDEASWVINRLNSGRELCIAVTNLLNNGALKGEAAPLIDELQQALDRYKRDEPSET